MGQTERTHAMVGKFVQRRFEGRFHHGRVAWVSEGLAHVKYRDGHEGDLTLKELGSYLIDLE